LGLSGGDDKLRRARKDARREDDEDDHGHPEKKGDVDRLAESRLGSFIVECLQQVDEVAVIQFAEAACSYLPRGTVLLLLAGRGRGRVWRRL
jgi:hypothetical protein